MSMAMNWAGAPSIAGCKSCCFIHVRGLLSVCVAVRQTPGRSDCARFPGGWHGWSWHLSVVGRLLLASPVRRLVQDPGHLLNPYVHAGMAVFEPGPGMGFFTLELARLVGPTGRVIAVDVEPRMIDGLRRRARKAGLLHRIDARVVQPTFMGIDDTRDDRFRVRLCRGARDAVAWPIFRRSRPRDEAGRFPACSPNPLATLTTRNSQGSLQRLPSRAFPSKTARHCAVAALRCCASLPLDCGGTYASARRPSRPGKWFD